MPYPLGHWGHLVCHPSMWLLPFAYHTKVKLAVRTKILPTPALDEGSCRLFGTLKLTLAVKRKVTLK